MHKKIANIISITVFSLLLLFLLVLTLILPKPDFSEAENRYLANFPKLSIDNILDGKFMDGFESYISDRFFGRNAWIKAKTSMDLYSGKRECNGVYITKTRLIEKVEKPACGSEL